MIYLYGLLEPARPGGPLGAGASLPAGLAGPVAEAACGALRLLYEPVEAAEIRPKRRHLLAHARVLEAAMALGTVLPMRFGMTAASPDDVAGLVAHRQAEVGRSLARLRGRAEFGVRIAAPAAEALEATLAEAPDLRAERDRLLGLPKAPHFAKAEFGRQLGEALARRRQAAQARLLSEIRGAAADHVLQPPGDDTELLRAEFLVDLAHRRAFVDRVAAVAAASTFAAPAAAAATVLGPSPAFHFTDLALAPPHDRDAA